MLPRHNRGQKWRSRRWEFLLGIAFIVLMYRSLMLFNSLHKVDHESRRMIVLLSNYRDSKRCAETLDSLFTNALRPDLISISMFDQIYSSEHRCMDVHCDNVGETKCRRHQVRRNDTLDAALATGPTFARYETEKGIDPNVDTFVLSIDSHLVFVHHWDAVLKQEWDSTKNPKSVLTTYPKATTHQHNWLMIATEWFGFGTTSIMCYARIETTDADTMVQYSAPAQRLFVSSPQIISQFAGGFNFGTVDSVLTVRNDPFTPFLFHGEEYSKAARLFTHGYDMYAPSIDIVYHWYETRPVVWERDWPERYVIQQRSKRRIRAALGLLTSSDDYDQTNITQFGLGTKRSMEQFITFSNIDPNASKDGENTQQFKNCKPLQQVPVRSG